MSTCTLITSASWSLCSRKEADCGEPRKLSSESTTSEVGSTTWLGLGLGLGLGLPDAVADEAADEAIVLSDAPAAEAECCLLGLGLGFGVRARVGARVGVRVRN